VKEIFLLEEKRHGRLVGRVHNGAGRTRNFCGVQRQGQAPEDLKVRLLEGQRADLFKLQRRRQRREPVRVCQRVLDRQAHIRYGQLRDDRIVFKFNHRMGDALPVDEDADLFRCRAKEVHRLDEFQALVHHGRGIDGDFFPH
jgi:hypothetical protein